MAYVPKKKKLEKDPNSPPPARYFCCRCGTAYSRQKGYFPVSHAPPFRAAGYVPICSGCIDEMFEVYRKRYNDERKAMRRICMVLDLYWEEKAYEEVERKAGTTSRPRAYISKMNNARFIDKNFDDTLEVEEELAMKLGAADALTDALENGGAVVLDEEDTVEPELVEFWGPGYTPAFYRDLQKNWVRWTGNMENIPVNEESLYKQICLLESTIARDGAEGKAIDRNVDQLQKVLASMNLKPAQLKEDADAAVDNTPMGVWLRRWEDYRPLPDPDPELENGAKKFIKYLITWVYGHTAKMLGVKNAHTQLYEEEIEKFRVELPEFEDDDDGVVLYEALKDVDTDGDES